jgi:hypothetical protein
VQIGDTPNQIKLDTLEIATGTGKGAVGELRLPASLTSIEAKIFSIGNAYTYTDDSARGTLRLGTQSQLTNLVVTQEFRFGWGCKAFLFGFPSNVNIRVGAPDAPATLFYMASRDYSSPVVEWTPDQAHVSIHVDDFRQGYLYLPKCDAYFHKLAVGVGTHATRCEGVLELNGGRFEIGERLRVGSRGRITSRVNGESGGPWLLSDDSGDFVIDENGLIEIFFEADPLDITQRHYWGLAAAGDQVDHFKYLNGLGRLTWNTDGLDLKWARKVAIHYDSVAEITYVGLDPRTHGTLFMIR